MKGFYCTVCGSERLEKTAGGYVCQSCKSRFQEESVFEHKEELRALFGEMLSDQKEEQIANIRRNLWTAAREKYTDSKKIIGYARELKKLLPEDFFCKFLRGGERYGRRVDRIRQLNRRRIAF